MVGFKRMKNREWELWFVKWMELSYIGRGTNQFHNWFESSKTAFERFSFSTFNLRKTRHSRGGTASPLQPRFWKTSAKAKTTSQLPRDQVRWSGTCTSNGNISVLDFAKYLYALDLNAFDFRVLSHALFLFAIPDSVLQQSPTYCKR